MLVAFVVVPLPVEPQPSQAGEGQLALYRGVLGGVARFFFVEREKKEKRSVFVSSSRSIVQTEIALSLFSSTQNKIAIPLRFARIVVVCCTRGRELWRRRIISR